VSIDRRQPETKKPAYGRLPSIPFVFASNDWLWATVPVQLPSSKAAARKHRRLPAAALWRRIPAGTTGHEETVANLAPMSVDDPFSDVLLAAGLIHECDWRQFVPSSGLL